MMRRPPAVALPILLGCLLVAPGYVQSQDLPVMECAISPTSLPLATEGVAYNASILTSTSPDLAGMTALNLPPGLTLVDRYLRGTPRAPGTFGITLKKYYRNGCGKPLLEKGAGESPPTNMSLETVTLKVRDTHPPTIASFTVTPGNLGSVGGSVTLTVQAGDNVGVSRVMMTTVHPDGHSGSALVPLTAGTAANCTWSITFSLGGTATSAPVTYSFTAAVSDAEGNTVKAGPQRVGVAAYSSQPLRLQPR